MSEQNENQSKSEQMKDKANAVYRKASEQADALYSKLPLDSINEKLAGKGIKVDVKSRKFKLALCGVAGVLAILLLWFCCRGGEDNAAAGNPAGSVAGGSQSAKVNPNAGYTPTPSFTDAGLEFFKSLEPLAHEFLACYEVAGGSDFWKKLHNTPELHGKTFKEILKHFRENEEFEKKYQTKLQEITVEQANTKVKLSIEKNEELNRHWHYIQDNFVSCFNQRLGSVRSVFQVVELDVDSLYKESEADGYSGEQWNGKCRLHDSQTGGEYMENFSCMLEWDKSGDEKYNKRSYDRPVELVPLMLHDFGQNNYLSDPRH